LKFTSPITNTCPEQGRSSRISVLFYLPAVRCTPYEIRSTLPAVRCTFMQNKPNFRKAAMFLNFYLTKYYENVPLRRRAENKPNTNPIRTQSNPIPQRDTQYAIRDTRYKPNQTQSPSAIRNTQYEIRDTNPIKANFKRGTYAALRRSIIYQA